MGIKRVARPVHLVDEFWAEVSCDKCGKSHVRDEREWQIHVQRRAGDQQQYVPRGFHLLNLSGGYGDTYPEDGDCIEIVVCCDCLKEWADSFLTPPGFRGNYIFGEIGNEGPEKALHTETGETMLFYPGGFEFIWPEGTEEPSGMGEDEDWWENADLDLAASPVAEYKLNTIVEHFKGRQYEVLSYGFDPRENSRDGFLVVYRALYGDSQVFCRPFFMFCETVDRPEFDYKGPRFRPIR